MDDLSASEMTRIQGHLLRFLASLLQRKGLLTMMEFGDLLSLYARVVSEVEPVEGAVLAEWAADIARPAGH